MSITEQQFLAIKNMTEGYFDAYRESLRAEIGARIRHVASRKLYGILGHDQDCEDIVAFVLANHYDRRVREGTLLNGVADGQWQQALGEVAAWKFIGFRVIDYFRKFATGRAPPPPREPHDPPPCLPVGLRLRYRRLTTPILTAGIQLYPKIDWASHADLLAELTSKLNSRTSGEFRGISLLQEKHRRAAVHWGKLIDKKASEYQAALMSRRVRDKRRDLLDHALTRLHIRADLEPLESTDMMELLGVERNNADHILQRYRFALENGLLVFPNQRNDHEDAVLDADDGEWHTNENLD